MLFSGGSRKSFDKLTEINQWIIVQNTKKMGQGHFLGYWKNRTHFTVVGGARVVGFVAHWGFDEPAMHWAFVVSGGK